MTTSRRPDQRSGSEETFEALFRHNYPRVIARLVHYGLTKEEARDLAQEVFLRAYRAIDTYRGEAAPATWLLRIAHNLFLNQVRSQRAKKRSSHQGDVLDDDIAELTPAADASSLDRLLADEDRERLREAVERLPSQMRRCVLLRVGSELKYREIAAVMGISIETVKSQLSQATQRLRDDLSGRPFHTDLR